VEHFLLQPPGEAARIPVEDTRALVQQLRIHYVELEAQNEELRRAQLELSEARDRYRDLYDFSPAGYLTVDDAGFIAEANLTAAALLSTDRARLPCRRLASFVAPSHRQAYNDFWATARAQRQHAADILFQLEDQRLCDMRLEVMRVLDPDLFAPPWRLLLTDVTARRRRQADRRRLEAQAQRREQLHRRQLLAGSMAHYVNGALTTIASSASMAREALSAGATVRGYVEDIEAAAMRVVSLNDQLLAYAGRTTIDVAPLGLSDTIRGMESSLDAMMAANATLILSLAPDLPAVIADRLQMQQVVMNLVANASDALVDGGVIELRTTSVVVPGGELAAMSHAGEAAEGRFVRLDISDTGTGLTSETRQHMFEPFFSTKLTGRGLGLAATLGIVNRHRGAIDVESHPGRGTRISILLPACTDEATAVAATIAQPVVGRPRGTALVVDDEREQRWVVLNVLSRSGMRVLEAVDGHQAIDLCKEYAGAIDVVLLDLHMPGPSESDVMRELALLAPQARIVLTSSHAPVEGRGPAGGAAFLQKPFCAGALLQAVLLA
jgi:nitrogen-specific signal transduction histidine kinase/CheY-like chemotaxis protein